ncbi:coiled-coil and C2 domain-containing protein 2A [Thrips palmi]|uniref:Coiled-coil and C2 domain-containing protein 2A n=1 Tax=Thrips palmi TaxID=161013 RepID=A0A6P8ZZT4_THRPL|nr:coiled-coil and C2 domain-containing protein 2A [Thrips palmi]
MSSLDVESGKGNVGQSALRQAKQPTAWVEDELPELSLSSTSASSSDEPDKIKQTEANMKSQQSIKNTSRAHRNPATAARQEYPEVVVRARIVETADNNPKSLKLDLPAAKSHDELIQNLNEKTSDSEPNSLHASNETTPRISKTPNNKNEKYQTQVAKDEVEPDITRRISVGDSSLDGSYSMTSQSHSETRSYRDRLKDRFQSVKVRAGNIKPETKAKRNPISDYISQQKAAQSRVDELFKKEEMELEVALEKHQNSHHKRLSPDKLPEQVSNADSSIDFFTRVWEPEPTTIGSPAPLASQDEGDSVSSSERAEDHLDMSGADKSKLLAADYLGLTRDEWEVVDHNAGPSLPDDHESRTKESELYFFPTRSLVPLEDRLAPGKEVRYREEEGLFVGFRPKVRSSNCHRLEKRLLEQGGRHWFGDDGELHVLPNPIRLTPYRPQIEDFPTNLQHVEYEPGIKPLIFQSNVASEGVNYALLEIHIGTLHFEHHPLFSQEHVLAQRLLNLYNQYRVREAMQQEERLSGRLDSLRQAYDNLQALLNSNAADISPQQLDRMKMYKKEVRATWQHLLAEGFQSRQLLVSLLSIWRDLKKLRDVQGFTCTPHRLVIHCEQLTQKELLAEKAKWEREIRQACIELEMEEQERFSSEWEHYQSQLKVWKKQEIMRGKVTNIQSESIPIVYSEEGTEDHTNSDRTSQIMINTGGFVLLDKPLEPKPVDISSIKAQVFDKMSLCLRPPGEPKLKISLKESEKATDDPKDAREKQRCSALKRCQLFIRIYYNNKEVCKTQSYSLNAKFKVVFNECFSIRILQPPESIHLAVFEDGAGGGRHQLAQVFLPIPAADKTLKTAVLDHHEFSSDRIVSFSHAGVGSGTFISGSPGVNGCLYTSGVVCCRAGWGIDKEKNLILAPQQKYLPPTDSELESSDFLADLGKDGSFDLTKLTEWAQKSQLDPNDPSNASFFFLLKNLSANSKQELNYFRLSPLQCNFDFCEPSFLDKNRRLRLLVLRAQGETEFRDWKQIPNREKEISTEIFKSYEKRLSVSARETELDVEMMWSDPLSSHRAWGRLYLERVYQRVLAQCRQAQRSANLHHIVAEDQVPDISTLGLTFMKWLQPKRPLRPLRKERKKVAVQSLAGQEVRLMVNVIRAFEVPVRKMTDSLLGSVSVPSSTNLGFATVAVRPFVEVSFQGLSFRTTTAEGANPTWNQDLQIPVRPGSTESDTLFIHLFDEVIVDLVEDDRQRETSIHQRLERNWLASLHIPFSTLVHNARIEGTFKMYSPSMLLGYERESHQRTGWQPGTFSSDQGGQLFPNRDATFLNLFITVLPVLNPPEPFNERLDSSEVSVLEEHLLHFEEEMNVVVPHRQFKTLVIDASGKSVCITRFFRPLTPPALLGEGTITEHMAARFVSMVPVAPNQGMFDVWLTCDQVLRLGWGDPWAHAVLLCCYLMGLGKKAWLLVGTGIPHGLTAYVFVHEKQEQNKSHFWVWDPTAGQCYSIFDSFCPLQRVYGLVNDENIWINLQKEELPRRTQFDLNRRSDWMAAFGSRRGAISAPVGSVQPSSLHYSPTSTNASNILQDKVENFLRDSLMKWRRTKITLWNRYCIATLRKLLPRLENASCFGSGENSSPHHSRELQHILTSHKVCGFPINLPYTSVEAIVEAVRATGVHHNQDENAEFALAVYIHPFPNNILSIWVYVASLTKLR